jgi:Xaa-Pro aminopeptidase
MDYGALAALHAAWIDYPGYPLARDFPREEYDLRVSRARQWMGEAGLDALVITSSGVGSWFTSQAEPHEWHDRCPARSAWYILTPQDDVLYMAPTSNGEHFNTTRRSTWVSQIRGIVERTEGERHEIWALEQIPGLFADLGLSSGRLGFELGDCMTLGISVNDFLRLRELMPHAALVDGSPVIRRLMSVHTPLEIERTRLACQAGIWVHERTTELLRPGLTERQFLAALDAAFATHFGDGYAYRMAGGWETRNPIGDDSNFFHSVITDRVFRVGDLVCRGSSGVSYRGYPGDVDRIWCLGSPSPEVERLYRITWECNRAMAAALGPGVRCAEVYAAGARVEARYGLPERLVGRVGHGLRNTGGLSIHPDCQTVLEPGMIISSEPMFGNQHGFFDLEDQYVITATGAEALNPLAPEHLPVIRG